MTTADAKGQNDGNPVRMDLPQDARAAGQARRVARAALVRWQLPGLIDSVLLAVSELVTNAVRHGRPPVSMQLERQDERLRLDVHDGSPATAPATVGEAADDAESGRGLAIVLALADDVQVEQVTGDGKILHVTFDRQPGAAQACAPGDGPA